MTATQQRNWATTLRPAWTSPASSSAAPLQAWLQQVDAVASRAELAPLLARAPLATGSAGLFFGFGSDQDFSNSSSVIAFAVGGGLSLPDRDYYLKNDARSVALRKQYLAHVARTLVLLGATEEMAAQQAATVLRVETALARATLSQVDKRDPYKLFHKMTRAQLQALTPGFDWDAYLTAVGSGRRRTSTSPNPPSSKPWGSSCAVWLE
jgi:endothelin-converting enzyme/putative endopeptidase